MNPRYLHLFALAVLAFSLVLAHAQEKSVTAEALNSPVDLGYTSAFENYAPYEALDTPIWKAANDKVGEIGGWRTYSREAYEAQKAKQAAAGKTEADSEADEGEAK